MQTDLKDAAAAQAGNQTGSEEVIRLDYSIEDPEERVKLVEKIIIQKFSPIILYLR